MIVQRGPFSGTKFNIKEFPLTIGRDQANSFTINDPEISRFHIRIKQRGSLHILEDLDSKNGCFINGDSVINSVVQNGDKILIGNTEIIFYSSSNVVRFANEVNEFNMILDQENGIQGPIDLHTNVEGELSPNGIIIIGSNQSKNKFNKKIYDINSNMILAHNLDEAGQCVLKGISRLSPSVSRCALFTWSSTKNQLIPTSTKHYLKESKPFLIHHGLLNDILHSKKGLYIPAKVQKDKVSRQRAMIPMIHLNHITGIIHIEWDQAKPVPQAEVELIHLLLNRCAPCFESILMRTEMDSLLLGMVETVIATIEAKDTYTVGHSERVCKYSMAIADQLKLNREVRKMLMISSLCHDIGKIGIPDAILKKASLLSHEEYQEMKLHPTIGANIIENMPNAHKFLSGVKYHHEKWDGTGYPEGLQGENIPFFGRIVAVADVFDAMISGRSYSGFIDESDAIEKIQKEADLFDPEIIKALVRAWESGGITQRTSTFSQESSKQPPPFRAKKKSE